MQVETIKGCSILVFDLDDTLYPEHEYVRSGFAAVDLWLKQNRDITGFSELANEQFNSGKRGNIFDIVLDQLGCGNPAELVPALVKVYREHDPAIKL